MYLNNKNKNCIGIGEICFHDFHILSFNFNPANRVLSVYLNDVQNVIYTISCFNVFDILYSNTNSDGTNYADVILGWEEIPNALSNDNFITEVRDMFVSNGGMWNDSLFAVRILMANMSEVKIICESITAGQSGDKDADQKTIRTIRGGRFSE